VLTLEKTGFVKSLNDGVERRRTPLPYERVDAGVVAAGAEYGADVHIHGAVAAAFLVRIRGWGIGCKHSKGNIKG
jgi:hypothetical protein